MLDLLSVLGLIIVPYEIRYGGVTCKLHHHVCGESGRVMNEQGEEGRAEHTPLRCACVRISVDDVRFIAISTHHLTVLENLWITLTVYTGKLTVLK